MSSVSADIGSIQHNALATTFIYVLEVFNVCNPGQSATQILMILYLYMI